MPNKARLVFRTSAGWQDPESLSWKRVLMAGARTQASILEHLAWVAGQLGAEEAIVETAHRDQHFRPDRTGPRLGTPFPDHPGVVVLLETRRHGLLRYACDSYLLWSDNLSSIAQALEVLYDLDRWGDTGDEEQYRGWQHLPTPKPIDPRPDAARFLLVCAEIEPSAANMTAILNDPDLARHTYNTARLKTHPDTTGQDGERFRAVVAAWEVLQF